MSRLYAYSDRKGPTDILYLYARLPARREIHTHETDAEEVLQLKCNGLLGVLPTCGKEVLEFDNLRPILVMKRAVETCQLDLVMDGGNVVKCGDTVVMTEKVFFENKDKSHDEVELLLHEAFGCDILFLPWDKKEVFGHSDGIVHYASDGKVLLTNYDDFSIYYYRRFRKALETKCLRIVYARLLLKSHYIAIFVLTMCFFELA